MKDLYSIKDLDWVEISEDFFRAESVFGTYSAFKEESGRFFWQLEFPVECLCLEDCKIEANQNYSLKVADLLEPENDNQEE